MDLKNIIEYIYTIKNLYNNIILHINIIPNFTFLNHKKLMNLMNELYKINNIKVFITVHDYFWLTPKTPTPLIEFYNKLTLSLDEARKNQLTRNQNDDQITSLNPPIPSHMPITPRSVSMTFHDKKIDCIITIQKKPDPSYKDVYIEDWSQSQVVEWLENLQVLEYKNNFIEQKITGFELVELLNVDFQALNEIGVNNVGDKLNILRNIRLEKEKKKK